MELISFEVQKPGHIVCKMTLCMDLDAWNNVREALKGGASPCYQLGNLITDKIEQIQKENLQVFESKKFLKKGRTKK